MPSYPVFSLPILKTPVKAAVGSPTTTVFTWQMPPAGTIMTGNFLPCQPGMPNGSNLSSVSWEILRNGQPEMTWIGYTSINGVTAGQGEQISIIAYNLPVGEPVQLTWKGWYTPVAQSPGIPQLPWLNPSGDGMMLLPNITIPFGEYFNLSNMNNGSQSFGPTGPIQLWTLNLSVSATSANGTGFGNVWVSDPNGSIILALGLGVDNGASQQALSMDCRGYNLLGENTSGQYQIGYTGWTGINPAQAYVSMLYTSLI